MSQSVKIVEKKKKEQNVDIELKQKENNVESDTDVILKQENPDVVKQLQKTSYEIHSTKYTKDFIFKLSVVVLLCAILLSNTQMPLKIFFKYIYPRLVGFTFASLFIILVFVSPIYALLKAKSCKPKDIWKHYKSFTYMMICFFYKEIFMGIIEQLFTNVGRLLKYFFLFLYLICAITTSIILAESIKNGDASTFKNLFGKNH